MRVSTTQTPSFADGLVNIPSSELDSLNSFLDWQVISDSLQDIQTDYDPLSLFKSLLLQTWHNLSDAALSSALHRDLVFMRFCGFSLDGTKPDAATICRFRKKLIKNNLLEPLLLQVNQSLETQGLKLSQGQYVSADATLIHSARRPRKKLTTKQTDTGGYEVDGIEYADDTDATWMKKGDSTIYGYSATVITDQSGLVESVKTHPANTSEMTRFDQDIETSGIDIGTRVLYDKGVASKKNRNALHSRGLKDGIMHKKPKGKPMRHWYKVRNRIISSKRFVTERTFGTIKRVYGLHRARYLGLSQVHAEVLLKSIAYHLKRAMNQYWKLQDSCA